MRRFFIWLMVPMIGLMDVWLDWTDLDFLLRLRISERALIRHAQQLRSTNPNEKTANHEWVGLFYISGVRVGDDETVRYSMQRPGIFIETGLYFDPDHLLVDTTQRPEERDRLFGPWVKFVWSD